MCDAPPSHFVFIYTSEDGVILDSRTNMVPSRQFRNSSNSWNEVLVSVAKEVIFVISFIYWLDGGRRLQCKDI